MKNLFQDQFSCNLMVWEVLPKNRNKNNEVKFYIDETSEVNIGDVIIGNHTPEQISVYEILEIVERRKGAVLKKDYLTVKTKHSFNKPIFSEFNLLVNDRFLRLYDIR